MNHLRGFGKITVAGDVLPVKFGTNQTAIFCELHNCDLKTYYGIFSGENFSKLELGGKQVRDLIYSALKDGARVDKKPFDLSPEDVGDIMDLMNTQPELYHELFAIMSSGYEALCPNVKGAKEAPQEPTLAVSA